MYRIPDDLDLSKIIGAQTSQLLIGQFDFQFSLGEVHFSVMSPITLKKNGALVGGWREGSWPDAGFYNTMNVTVTNFEIIGKQRIIIHFENGIEMHLCDNDEQYESMKISIEGNIGSWII